MKRRRSGGPRLIDGPVGLVLTATVCVVIVVVLLAPAKSGNGSDRAGDAAPSPTAASDGQVVGSSEPAEAATGDSAALATTTNDDDPLEEPEDGPYTSDSSVIDAEFDSTSRAVGEIRTALEDATDEVHACESKLRARHEELGRPGRPDPLQCVYDATAMEDERGVVRMDIVTPDGYSYYVDASDGLRYRYSEYDGAACRSVDGVAGCGAW